MGVLTPRVEGALLGAQQGLQPPAQQVAWLPWMAPRRLSSAAPDPRVSQAHWARGGLTGQQEHRARQGSSRKASRAVVS